MKVSKIVIIIGIIIIGITGSIAGASVYSDYRSEVLSHESFEFTPTVYVIDARNGNDLTSEVDGAIEVDFFRDINGTKQQPELRVENNTQIVTIEDASNTMIHFAVIETTGEYYFVPSEFEKWNEVVDLEVFDINNDTRKDFMYELNIKPTRDYYMFDDKTVEIPQLALWVTVIPSGADEIQWDLYYDGLDD